jgi:AAHS family benzoate transporter-like MFS transporter
MQTADRMAGSSRSERVMLGLVAAFAFLELYDLACYGVTVPAILADRSMAADVSAAGTAGSLVAVGMMCGAALAGALVVRVGPLKLMLVGAAVFSAGMLCCGVAPSIGLFGSARLIVGVGLGAVLPALTAYVAEVSSQQRRCRNVGLMMAGGAAGGVMAPLVAAVMLPEFSWRWVYVAGAAPALLLLPLAARLLPESPVHLRLSSQTGGFQVRRRKELFGLRPLLTARARAATALFWVMSFCGLLLVFGISTWLPTIMSNSGYPLGSALLQTAVLWAGAGAGMVAGGRVADSLGPKPVVIAAFGVGSLCLLGLSLRPSLVVLFVLMFVSGLGLLSNQVLVNAFMAVHYPDELRGPGIGWALAVGRLGAILGPAMGGWILAGQLDVQWNFYLFAVPGVIGAIAAALLPPVRSADPSPPIDRSAGANAVS